MRLTILSRVLEDLESVSRAPDAVATANGGDVRLSPPSSQADVSAHLGERPA